MALLSPSSILHDLFQKLAIGDTISINPTDPAHRRTVIVGGGLAGLAAAVALAERGIGVTLLESRPRLGGRAGSFVDQTTGELIDNCQHVSMGCCTNFRHFCETVGIDDRLRTEERLHFVGPDCRVHRFAAAPWPAPLHLLPAFRRLGYLSRQDRKQISRGLRALARWKPGTRPAISFADWLADHQQNAGVIEKFWNVVLVSALSETSDRIDAVYARKVFVDSFLASRHGWRVQIPSAPLEELYGKPLTDWLSTRGTAVRLKAGAARVLVENDRAVAVELRSGETLPTDHVILAVPHDRVLPLLPETLAAHPQLAGIRHLEIAPISSVHLWFDREITPLPHAVFIDRLSQWIFNRTRLNRSDAPAAPANENDSFYYQVVISASRLLAGRSQEEIIKAVLSELAAVWSAAADAQLKHARVVTEHKAVFSPLPGVDDHRPPQQSPVDNLQLAGDWTRTGWPATMEGAVRSGFLAAENVLRSLGQSQKLLQPDLPAALLSRFLFGL